MSILRFETSVKTTEDVYEFNLNDFAVGVKNVFLMSSSDDDKSDFELMKSRLNNANQYALGKILATIIYYYYNDDNLYGDEHCCNNQTIKVKALVKSEFQPVKVRISVTTVYKEEVKEEVK